MACVALTSLMATIELEFVQPIPRVSLDDEASIKSFFEKLSSLQAFVQEKSRGGAAIRDLEIKIRDFALDAEDRIEIQLSNFLLAKDRDNQEKASQKLRQILREAAELLKSSNNISDEGVEVNETQRPLIPRLKHASESKNVAKSGRSSWHSPKLEGRMVGRHHDHKRIKESLIYGPYQLNLISIVGMMGIGKTTLAMSVYEDPLVVSQYEVRGWITIPQEYNESQMLCDLLQSIMLVEPDEITKGKTPDELLDQVYKCLKGKRFLIVLDNLSNIRAWDDIRRCFPNDRNGSSIMLTTMHFDRGYYVCLDDYIYNMTLLDPKESWDLFCNNPFLKQHMAPKFEKIRSHVLEKCEGLPESIVTVAKRLSKCSDVQQEWKKVEKELESLGVLDSSALTLSYNQLPQHLQVCFLYFGVFPKRSAIRVKHLIRLWIAEGFLKPLEHKGLENQAYEYLQELIDRCLVLIDNRSSDGKIKTCRMHSALHSFCVREAQKEGIFCAVNTQQHPQGSFNMFANSCRWLSLYTHSFDYYVLFRTNNPRSIFFFQDNVEIYVPFKLLRVLAFAPSSFLQRVPTQLRDLVFLRYLSVTEWFEGLDYIVLTNRNLQTLVVSGNESHLGAPTTLHLPSTIWESPQLQHLELDTSYAIDPPRVVKDNMQTLSWVSPTHCRTEVYYRFPNIKKLKIFCKDDLEPSHTGGSCNNSIILDNLDYLVRLEMLTILVSVGCAVTLPDQPMFPSQLKKLRLSGTNLCERDLAIIGMLPQLEVLKLENAFHWKVWEVDEGGFRQLKFLLLEAKKLEQWLADDNSFPYLERLVLRFCFCLDEVPLGFQFNGTLHTIELEHCGRSVVTSAKNIQIEQQDFGNVTFEIKILGSECDES